MIDIRELFTSQDLMKQALTLAHHGKTAPYERLEFLGDRVLGLIISDLLYHTYPHESEGELARRFTELVREETVADVARQLGLPNFLITDENDLRDNQSVLADVCEACLGALYLDKDYALVQQFVIPLWTPIMKQNKQAPKDAKSELQEWSQKKGKNLPTYTVVNKTGLDHAPVFDIEVKIKGYGHAMGTGESKKTAEQAAAIALLEKIHGKK